MRSISCRASLTAGPASSSSVGTSIVVSSERSESRSITLRSSRTLPGHGLRSSQSMASFVKRSFRGRSAANDRMSSGRSSTRSASGGTVIVTTFRR